MNEAQGILVPVEFALRSRLRWLGVAVAIRCPFSSSVSVCFGNDPSTPNEISRTGKANRRVAPGSGRERQRAAYFFVPLRLRDETKIEYSCTELRSQNRGGNCYRRRAQMDIRVAR